LRALRGNLVTPFQMIERGQIEVIDNKITSIYTSTGVPDTT
jgi:hypothetical protein